ncbi:heavy-metal-associated domain-containing protein [Flavobacterium oreochromis]|uniref:Metal transporter n=2 Tax=Flavobacterium TaxID=237 RepID=A0A246GD16_9FLAO|nr:metal transporter [Flavobacterium oreochromis]OWP77338.1 metal transporter [Flavobacterium oreochromis]OWP79217.1 metal transporter [Flavobacterium oreochromis]POR18558.1 metal transporter [Flavobacterium columnare]QYS86783.1 metal transporter [Flavobacterium oreochromis]
MKNIVLVLVLFISVFGFAQEKIVGSEFIGVKKNKNAKYNIEVNGNCEMCKKRIERAAFSISGVKMAQYDIEGKMLHLVLNEEKCTLLDVEKAIGKIGHDTKNVKAIQEDYEKLHGCCRYERN